MPEGYIFYGIISLSVFIIALFGVFRDFAYKRMIMVVVFLIFLPTAFLATMDLMSRPRPVELMLPFTRPNPEKAKVMAVFMKENHYMMLLLNWDGLEYPRYFKFPWDKDKAEQLQKAINDAKRDGNPGVELTLPFDNSLDKRNHPWANPIPQLKQQVPKEEVLPDVFEFSHPTQDL